MLCTEYQETSWFYYYSYIIQMQYAIWYMYHWIGSLLSWQITFLPDNRCFFHDPDLLLFLCFRLLQEGVLCSDYFDQDLVGFMTLLQLLEFPLGCFEEIDILKETSVRFIVLLRDLDSFWNAKVISSSE